MPSQDRPFGLAQISSREVRMKCDICGQDLGNSDQLQKHMERAHPTGTGKSTELEKPDLLGDTPEESAEIEVPNPTH